MERDELWSIVLMAKNEDNTSTSSQVTNTSTIWRSLRKLSSYLERGIKWSHKGGSFKFWFDNRSSMKTIRSLIMDPLNKGEEDFTFKNVIFELNLTKENPSNVVSEFLSTFESLALECRDTATWGLSPNDIIFCR